ncbi:dienelactone hydrolase [Skermanella aerolata]|uniref:alpha/beta fold hydrolase n=1 Tax=Skermanella aerolata TaxID=393310 RepID=UPI003D24D7CD
MTFVAIDPPRRIDPPGRTGPMVRVLAAAMLGMLVLLHLAGCTATPAERSSSAGEIASRGGLSKGTLRSRGFALTTWSRFAPPAEASSAYDVDVYIEGDGYAWETTTDPSSDPTPLNPVALRLAAADRAPSVLYLARPCQFRPAGTRDSCGVPFWTSQRFAESVVASLDEAIDRTLPPSTRRRLTLIGYSGGGGLAVLLAARRSDVAAVVTVAGNVAHGVWTSHHRVSPLLGSLDPIDSAARLAAVPQLHLVGANDRIVPRLIADSFARRSPPGGCIRIVTIAGASHDSGWLENWPALLDRIPACPGADGPAAAPVPAR